ncbi:rubrerythrin family protein [Candidatus Methanoliparum sp. LAM-1]|uniref:rubrerythrin family protein n=1 Tax=Candidatus Methanoliparum sp. LAM-1 TaxID=2874846 RepID=UPI001E2EC569|nr:rubrerythrin family protein [Candidatus Methanoliparum sp. LAM-1]BDC36606.1 rubrerythrin [Candidatus Methanoliparum sp. LAM-1]
MKIEREMTKKFIEEAFAGESMAHMKYQIFSEVAEKEGFPNIANLFRAISFAELVHARNHYKSLGNVKKTEENLQECINGENYEVNEMYPVFNNTAKLQNEKDAEKNTYYALEAEKIHEIIYKESKDSVKQNKDIDVDTISICPVCGYTVKGEPVDRCPICGTSGKKFAVFKTTLK